MQLIDFLQDFDLLLNCSKSNSSSAPGTQKASQLIVVEGLLCFNK
jgi:hypothetical protein